MSASILDSPALPVHPPAPDALLRAAFEEGRVAYWAGLRDDEWRPALCGWLMANAPRDRWLAAAVAHCRGYREARERAAEGMAAVLRCEVQDLAERVGRPGGVA